MLEFVFLLVFAFVLLFTGISMLTVFAAVGVSFFIMFLVGMLGFALKLLPWLIVIGLAIWFFNQKSGRKPRARCRSKYRHY